MLSRLAAARSSFAIISSARRSKMGQTVRMPAGRTTTTRRNMAGGGYVGMIVGYWILDGLFECIDLLNCCSCSCWIV